MAGSSPTIQTNLKIDMSVLRRNIHNVPDFLDKAVAATMKYNEPQVANWMRTNASWKDQTSNARNGLSAQYAKSGDVHAIVIYHSVPYGIWLEVRWSGTYAIIQPALEEYGPKVMQTLEGILSKFGGGGSSII